ncbi:AraC family transcriptional regulator [Pseudoxanthobacter sp.]|uniref:AraC family transcriptional regulator n=1 Tax=Pseudoxanthobacter sp. TaxID=1925742 RepID=UPI002FE0BAC4
MAPHPATDSRVSSSPQPAVAGGLDALTVFHHLHAAGVPLRASSQFGPDMAAALWDRNETVFTSYDSPNHHTLSLYVEGGSGIRRVHNGARHAGPGTGALCLMPGDVTTTWDVSGSVHLFHLYAARASFDRLVEETLDSDPATVELRDEFFFRDATLENVIRHGVLRLNWDEPAERIAVTQAANMLFTYLAARFTNRHRPLVVRGGLAPAVLARVTAFVEAHLDRPLTIADLAAVAGLSPYHFARMFRASAGESPHAFVLARRIARARDMIARPPRGEALSLAGIAAACGFASQSHLTQRFRAATGLTPGAFAKAAGQNREAAEPADAPARGGAG